MLGILLDRRALTGAKGREREQLVAGGRDLQTDGRCALAELDASNAPTGPGGGAKLFHREPHGLAVGRDEDDVVVLVRELRRDEHVLRLQVHGDEAGAPHRREF